ncbi:hypothetical protein FNU76_01645 [Chitinimonas arctica]|uniref:Uncharacterized protein n=1 Tax=Chitinimonas arctica TaxID=2594795 RepID=A0A516SAJ0_9NEIS|nr:hypothetical protein [Chitinimonas arctica]QDQ25163.1 hypothetical protein FNU76_01645 [Chitinimonas arctica]
MISNELAAELKERCCLWQEGVLPDTMFEAFVLTALCDIDATGYKISDYFNDDAISLLLAHGEQQLKSEGVGGMRVISAGREVNISYFALQYRKLFDQWARRGWIELSNENSVRRC